MDISPKNEESVIIFHPHVIPNVYMILYQDKMRNSKQYFKGIKVIHTLFEEKVRKPSLGCILIS